MKPIMLRLPEGCHEHQFKDLLKQTDWSANRLACTLIETALDAHYGTEPLNVVLRTSANLNKEIAKRELLLQYKRSLKLLNTQAKP